MEKPHSPQLSLNLSPPWLLPQQSYDPHNSSNLQDYIARLEQELFKVESFKRELPISALLLTNAIGRLKEEVGKNDKELVCDLNESPTQDSEITVVVDGDKKTWMQSAQLWNSDHASFIHLSPKGTPDGGGGGGAEEKAGAFSSSTEGSDNDISPDTDPYEKISGLKISGSRKNFVPILPATPLISPSSSEGSKKHRRCWSPELHRRFVDALDKLGGSQVATPRQIRELMKVHGLTNDEVKSHLQKYRLHVRKSPHSNSYMNKQKLSIHDVKFDTTASKSETSQSVSPQGSLRMPRTTVGCSSAASRCRSIERDGEENSDCHSWANV